MSNQNNNTIEYKLQVLQPSEGEFEMFGMHFPEIPKTGSVQINLINPKRTMRLGIGPFTLIEKNVQIGTDAERFFVTRNKKLNLENAFDRKMYAMLRIHPFVTGMGRPKMLQIFEPEKSAIEEITIFELVSRCFTWIKNSSDQKLKELAELLGMDTRNSSSVLIQNYLLKYAKDNPQALPGQEESKPGFLDVVNSVSFNLRLLFQRLLKAKLIRFVNGGYSYFPQGSDQSIVIGVNDKQALEWLSSDESRMLKLQNAVKNDSSQSGQTVSESIKVETANDVLEDPFDSNAEKNQSSFDLFGKMLSEMEARHKDQIENLENRLKEISTKSPTTKVIVDPAGPNESGLKDTTLRKARTAKSKEIKQVKGPSPSN